MQTRMGLSTIYFEGSRVGLSVLYLVSTLYFSPCIACPTADLGIASSISTRSYTLVGIDHEIISGYGLSPLSTEP